VSTQVSVLRAKLLEREREIEVLQDRIASLRAALLRAAVATPPEWRLTCGEAVLVAMLLEKDLVSVEDGAAALRAAGFDGTVQSLRVLVSNARRKVADFRVPIENMRWRGYAIPAARRQTLRRELGFDGPARASC